MVQLHDIYVVLHAGVVVLALAVIFIAWRHRAARGAHALAALMVGVMIWAGAAAAMVGEAVLAAAVVHSVLPPSLGR